MHPPSLAHSWDLYLFGLPLIAVLVFAYFHLDELWTRKRKSPVPPPHRAPAIDPEGKSMRTDPDGRPW